MSCPCGNPAPIAECCGPYLDGTRLPPTAEALMRSRYTAFATGNVDYIHDTHDPATAGELDREATRAWSEKSEWLGFELIAADGGGADDDAGTVEFVARYRLQGSEHRHHETATFTKIDGRWFFADSRMAPQEPFRRSVAKVGRNDPCPCGSGKKYKRCCGGAVDVRGG
jgi:SEC-C motif-containing protein